MPKMTAKYKGAVNTAHNRNLPAVNTTNQEELYTLLQDNGFFWNSSAKVWEEHDLADADEPTGLIMIRVWSEVKSLRM